LKALKPGGVLTYSTCTITVTENEQVLDSVLSRLPVQVEEITIADLKMRPGLTRHGSQRFNRELAKAIRLYPWENQSEGFFVARLRKTGSFGTRKAVSAQPAESSVTDEDRIVRPLLLSLSERYGIPITLFDQNYCSLQQGLYCASPSFRGFPFNPLLVKVGLPLAHLRKGQVKMTTEGAHLLGRYASKNTLELTDLESMEKYVNREDFLSGGPDSHQILVHYLGMPLGHAVSSRGRLLSRFPRSGYRFDLQPN
jgi:NOL1/NOP2/fmu family ribosome biogenesis protein